MPFSTREITARPMPRRLASCVCVNPVRHLAAGRAAVTEIVIESDCRSELRDGLPDVSQSVHSQFLKLELSNCEHRHGRSFASTKAQARPRDFDRFELHGIFRWGGCRRGCYWSGRRG